MKESLERRLYQILSDGYFHSSYDLTEKLNGHNRPLFRLSGRVSDLKARGCEIETKSENDYHHYLLFDGKVTDNIIGTFPKRVWYRLCWTPSDPFAVPLKKYADRKDERELVTVFGDGTRVVLV